MVVSSLISYLIPELHKNQEVFEDVKAALGKLNMGSEDGGQPVKDLSKHDPNSPEARAAKAAEAAAAKEKEAFAALGDQINQL